MSNPAQPDNIRGKLFCSQDNFQVSDIVWKWLASCVFEEPNYYVLHDVSIAYDDEHIEAHKQCWKKQSNVHSGILL